MTYKRKIETIESNWIFVYQNYISYIYIYIMYHIFVNKNYVLRHNIYIKKKINLKIHRINKIWKFIQHFSFSINILYYLYRTKLNKIIRKYILLKNINSLLININYNFSTTI